MGSSVTREAVGTYSLRERAGVPHQVVAFERRRAGLRRAEAARLELLPAHVRVACKKQTGTAKRRTF